MATLIPTLTLTSADALSDVLSVSATDSLTATGEILVTRVTCTDAGSQAIWLASGHNKTYIFLKNTSTVETINVVKTNGGDHYLTLAPLEWAFMPWNGSCDLYGDMAAGKSAVLEVMAFETAY